MKISFWFAAPVTSKIITSNQSVRRRRLQRSNRDNRNDKERPCQLPPTMVGRPGRRPNNRRPLRGCKRSGSGGDGDGGGANWIPTVFVAAGDERSSLRRRRLFEMRAQPRQGRQHVDNNINKISNRCTTIMGAITWNRNDVVVAAALDGDGRRRRRLFAWQIVFTCARPWSIRKLLLLLLFCSYKKYYYHHHHHHHHRYRTVML